MAHGTPITSVEDAERLVSSRRHALLGFWAPWSRGSGEVLQEVSQGLAQDSALADAVAYGSLDVNANEDLAFDLGVSTLPYFAFYRNGRQVSGMTQNDPSLVVQACRSLVATMDEDSGTAATESAPTQTQLAPPSLTVKKSHLVNRVVPGKPVVIMVSGDRSKVGKSSVCLGLLGGLLQLGYEPKDLAYIKPATQCESPQLVNKWCDAHGVANRGIGPVVFYKGFTREFLKGNIGTSADLLRDIRASVDEIGKGKKVVLVDGVGYPAVGSICGVSNADIAETLGCPVVIVGRPGVGDAVDSFNLNACFFKYKGARVLGGIFNRLPLDGFYSLDNCKEAVTSYFAKYQPDTKAYGFLPDMPDMATVRDELEAEHKAKGTGADDDSTADAPDKRRLAAAELLIGAFNRYVDLAALLEDAYNYLKDSRTSTSGHQPPAPSVAAQGGRTFVQSQVPQTTPAALVAPSPWARAPTHDVVSVGVFPAASSSAPPAVICTLPSKRKTREEIEAAARKQGAKAGG